jgi:thiopurine S-methyltransferase
LFPNINIPDGTDASADSCFKPVRVFVPLCGKSVDMAYFAKQNFVHEVVGVDGIQKALDVFAQEHAELNLQPAEAVGQYDRLSGNKITLLKGDFFELDEATTNGRFDAIFDRGSMVAIQPALREDYVQTISRLMAPGGRILLVTIERRSGTEEDKTGPPFSISEAEVRQLYEGQTWVESVSLLPGEEE